MKLKSAAWNQFDGSHTVIKKIEDTSVLDWVPRL